ncbi:MAG: hypothetical protein ACYTG0_27100 [Planctomycetota bacterium]|jgi:hypothetical protein
MADSSPLLDLIAAERPGATVEVLDVGKSLVVGLSGPSGKIWIALDHRPSSLSAEHVLGCVANMMVCCLSSGEECHYRCRNERRVTAGRMKKFLGQAGFQRFVENAPIVVGGQPTPT